MSQTIRNISEYNAVQYRTTSNCDLIAGQGKFIYIAHFSNEAIQNASQKAPKASK